MTDILSIDNRIETLASGLSVIRRAVGVELIRKTGQLASELRPYSKLEVRRPGFSRRRWPAVQLLNNKEVMRQSCMQSIERRAAKLAIEEALPDLTSEIDVVFSDVDPYPLAKKGQYYIELLPDASTASTLEHERNEIINTLNNLNHGGSDGLYDADDDWCDDHSRRMTIVYCSERSSTYEVNKSLEAAVKILPLRCTLEPALLFPKN